MLAFKTKVIPPYKEVPCTFLDRRLTDAALAYLYLVNQPG